MCCMCTNTKANKLTLNGRKNIFPIFPIGLSFVRSFAFDMMNIRVHRMSIKNIAHTDTQFDIKKKMAIKLQNL